MSKEMTWTPEVYSGESLSPWRKSMHARAHSLLAWIWPSGNARREYSKFAHPCPCGVRVDALRWFWYSSPWSSSERSAGRTYGWLTFCRKCDSPVELIQVGLVMRD